MSDRELASLEKMIEHCDKCLQYCNGYDFKKFTYDDKTIDAVIFNISQIGELVKNLSDKFLTKYNDIEWIMIKGLRNRIVHDYDGLNLKSIWVIIQNDLPELKEQILSILEKEKN